MGTRHEWNSTRKRRGHSRTSSAYKKFIYITRPTAPSYRLVLMKSKTAETRVYKPGNCGAAHDMPKLVMPINTPVLLTIRGPPLSSWHVSFDWTLAQNMSGVIGKLPELARQVSCERTVTSTCWRVESPDGEPLFWS
jgi:hypothetical protein